jgi:hypothetical protein
MTARVMIIGVGDVGYRFAAALAEDDAVDSIILADRPESAGGEHAGMLASCYDTTVGFHALDGTRQDEVEKLLRRENPDLLIQSASLLGPWATIDRRDPVALAIRAAGLGIQLPAQLPILMTVMKAARTVGFSGPIANISFPDVTHPILGKLGLAPTIGLGNVSMHHVRVRAALRATAVQAGTRNPRLPLVRVVGHHCQVYGVCMSELPKDPDARVRVYIGEDAKRDDPLAYQGYPIKPGIHLNTLTCAAALPVLRALLPGGPTLRYSSPAPNGLPGGYPVRIEDGKVALDLRENVDLTETINYFNRVARGDGIERIGADGTVSYTQQAMEAIADVDPTLAEPLAPADALTRFERLRDALGL